MEAMRCDRCKKFYVVTDRSDERPSLVGKRIFGIRLIDAHDYRLRTFDLCTDCAIEVYNFINNQSYNEESKTEQTLAYTDQDTLMPAT